MGQEAIPGPGNNADKILMKLKPGPSKNKKVMLTNRTDDLYMSCGALT